MPDESSPMGYREISEPWASHGDVKVSAGTIRWSSIGKGFPVILFPKLGGWIADWRHVAPILAQKYQVIAIDNPGHGDSILHGEPPYLLSVPESAAMMMAVLDELGIEHCSLIGNSLGGSIAAIMAGFWPEKFAKLILLSVALGAARSRADLEKQDQRSYDSEGSPRPRSLDEVAKTFGITDAQINTEMNHSRAKAGQWVRASERGVGRAGIADYLPRITASTLLIYGERGGCKQFEAMGLSKIPNAKSVRIPNASSFAHQDQPHLTAKLMMEFLAL